MKVRGKDYRAVWMKGRDVVVINQPLLPHRFELLRLKNHRETARAIKTMIVRGAGTIGARKPASRQRPDTGPGCRRRDDQRCSRRPRDLRR